MTEFATSDEANGVRITLDAALYPLEAVYGAAYVFIDRCYVRLERAGEGQVAVVLRPKRAGAMATREAQGELENELLAQAWRLRILERNRDLIEQVTAQALSGAAGPPGLDELLAMDLGDATAFEDPLGIAVSWEEKYGKSSGEAPSERDANATDATDATDATRNDAGSKRSE